MDTIQIDDISTLSIQVTEEIESKHIHTFLKTSILNDNPNVSKKTHYYFFYNQSNRMYEILYFENSLDTNVEVFDIVEKFNNNDNIVNVLISDSYFILCKNGKIIALKKIDDVKIEEIKLYIEQMYKIENFEVIVLTKKDTEQLESNSKNNSYNNCYNLYNKKSFYIFCSFLLTTFILFVIIVYFTFYEKEKTIKSSMSNDVSIKKNYTISSRQTVIIVICK